MKRIKKKENQKKIAWNVRKGAVAVLTGMMLAVSATGGTMAYAVSDSYTGESIDGTKPFCKLEMQANADEGTGFALASLGFAKGNATRTINAKFYYKSENKKYYTKGSTSVGGTTTYVEMKTRVAGSVNVGATSTNKVKYGDITWKHSLKVGNPPATDTGWTQKG